MVYLVNLMYQIIVFAITSIIGTILRVEDLVMGAIEDYEVFENVAKFLSSFVGNFYFWQTVATLGFCHSLRRLGAKFPPQTPSAADVDAGISTERLLEEKEKSLTEAATKNEELDKQNSLLLAKVDRLEKELDFISKDRYDLVRQTCTLQNRLGDFESWPQYREEYDRLVTEYGMMQRQREREDISHQQILAVAKEAKLELASAKLAAAMSKIDHSEELNQLKRERDDARENYETLVNTTKAAAANTATMKENTHGEKVLQEENTRLSLALRSKTSLLAKKTSEFDRMQALLKSRSNHSASQLNEAASTIRSLEEDKKRGNKRIADLEKELTKAKADAEQMEEMYVAVAFGSPKKAEDEEKEGGEEQGEEKEEGDVKVKEEEEAEDEQGDGEEEQGEEEDGGGEQPPRSWLLQQVVAMSKKAGGTPGTEDKSGKSDDDGDEDGEDGGNRNEEEAGGNEKEEKDKEEEEKRIHDENEDLFKDMMG